MKKIYLDIGNSRIKVATRSLEKWIVDSVDAEKPGLNLLSKLPKNPENVQLILSSVRTDWLEAVRKEISAYHFMILDKKWIPGHLLDYETPDTLGLDRYLSCLGAVTNTNNDTIVIDAGTAITIDFMTSKQIFKGGVIMPGKKLIMEAIEGNLPELPLPDDTIPDQFPGKSTVNCMRWGVNGSLKSTLRFFINRYQEMAEEKADIVLTGGDSSYVASLVENEWDVIPNEFILFEGMELYSKVFAPDDV